MEANQSNEKNKSIWGESKWESKILWIAALPFFAVTIIDLIFNYESVVEHIRTSALSIGFLMGILGYLSELRYRLFSDVQKD
jgi:hypothetical protein